MNKTHLISLLRNPVAATAADEAALRDITRTYPYFQAARVVFTTCLHQQHSYLFEKELKTTALHAGSRSKLYHYIHSKPSEASAQEIELPVTVQPTELISIEPPDAVTPVEPLLPENISSAEHEEIAVAPAIDEAEKNKNTHTLPGETRIEREAEQEAETVTQITTETEQSVTSIVLEKAETATDANEKSISPVELASPHSFDEWLSILTEHHLPETIIKDLPPADETDVISEEISSGEETTPTPEEVADSIQQPEHQIPSFDPDSIIERFIAESPSISRPKAEFFNPVNMAKLSVEEDEDLVTETLARINAKQGNYKKAIRMYEKLCLKFPEKMPYFVDLIQKIKSDHKLD